MPSLHAQDKGIKDMTTLEYPSKASSSFRDAIWGHSKTSVKANEKATLVSETSDTLNYKGRSLGVEAMILYSFSEGKFVEGTEVYTQKLASNSEYVSAFESLKNQLIEKYGAPSQDKTNWAYDPPNKATEVKMKGMSKKAVWGTENTVITLSLSEEDGQFKLFTVHSKK